MTLAAYLAACLHFYQLIIFDLSTYTQETYMCIVDIYIKTIYNGFMEMVLLVHIFLMQWYGK